MTVPGPSARYLYLFDPTASLGVDLTASDGQVGEFHPPALNQTLQDLAGSASVNPAIQPAGHATADDINIPIWAHTSLQELLDDLVGVTPADRSDARIIVTGWYAAAATGGLVDAGQAYLVKVAPMTPNAALTQLMTTWRFNGLPGVGSRTLLHLSTKTADGDTQASSVDHGASTAFGGTGYWGYTTYTADGATGLLPRVLHSSDNISFSALITFTAKTATTGGGEVKATASATTTVNRYVACDWDFTGSPGAGTTARLWIAFKRNLTAVS